VDVPGRHARDPEPLGELDEPTVAGPIPAPERSLQLDPEAVDSERGDEPTPEDAGAIELAPLPAPGEGAVAGAAREADEPLAVLLERVE
jgi:hypothetical protein